MFRNNFITAYRYFKKNWSFTVINILGLTLGFFCFFLLNGYVLKEKSYDLNQKDVYRLLQKVVDKNSSERELAVAPPRLGIESESSFDEILLQTQVLQMGRGTYGNDPSTTFHEFHAIIDDNFFKVFDFEFIEGSAESIVSGANGLILTESIKQRFFGEELALNKTLKAGGSSAYSIVGVIEDFPENTHMENRIFLTSQMATEVLDWYKDMVSTNWERNWFQTYFKVVPHADLNELADKITDLAKLNNSRNPNYNSVFTLQPVQEIHLYEGEVEGEVNKNKGSKSYVRLFFLIGVLILIVASFNYAGLMNISFMDRSKEINLRQIIGANKKGLLLQFLTESLLITLISMGLAFLLLLITKPFITSWFETTIGISGLPISGIIITVVLGIVISLLSVSYPFWDIIKSKKNPAIFASFSNSGSKLPFRRSLLVFQFMAVIAFISATLVFYKQIKFLETKDKGLKIEGLATIDINSRILRDQFESIKSEFLRLPEVKSVSVSSRVPGEWKNLESIKAKSPGEAITDAKDLIYIGADQDFLNTYEIKLLDGLNFSGLPSDSTKVLINSTVVQTLNLNENPVGGFIDILHDDNEIRVQIAGVVEDFQMEDFRSNIRPLIIGNWNNPIQSIDYYTLRIHTSDWSKTQVNLSAVNDAFDQSTPMELHILSDQFARFFKSDKLRFKLLNFFSVVVVLLAMMGLFAMSAFVAKSRTKEIGIRKVLGSTIYELIRLLSLDFIRLMLIGLLITTPIVWYVLKEWLTEFAFHIELKIWMIAISGLICLILTLATVSFQAIKAATANPVKSLRNE